MRVDDKRPEAGGYLFARARVACDRGRTLLLVAALATALAAVLSMAGVAPGGIPEALASSPADGGGTSDAYEVRTCDSGTVGLSAPEYESLQLHNEAREGAGLGHLCVNPTLTEAARAHAADMLERDYFGHYTPEGTSPIQRMEAEGYSGWSSWGENIAWGSGTRGDSKEIFAALMDSPGHRENILKDGFLEVGIGALGGDYNGNSGSGMYAMDFGSRSGQAHEYPEVLSENGGGADDQAPADDPLAGQPAGEVTPEDQEGAEPVEPQPESGESPEEEQQEVADAQQAICEVFGETRERVIGDLRADAEEEAAEEGPASKIIAETKTSIADQFEESLLTASFCDFGKGTPSGDDEEAPEETTGEETTSPETTSMESTDASASPEATSSPESTSSEQVEQTSIIQQNSEGGSSGDEAGQGEVDAEKIREQVERDVRRALAGDAAGAVPGVR